MIVTDAPKDLILAFDPDTHHTGVAVVDTDGRPVFVGVCSVPAKFKGAEAVCEMVKVLRNILWPEVLAERIVAGSVIVAIVVEGQEITYSARSGKNPRSLLPVAQIAGAALAVHAMIDRQLFLPYPAEWKGQVPKQIHQARICNKLGWAYELVGDKVTGYARPTGMPAMYVAGAAKLNPGDWKHVMDAIGLGMWAALKLKGMK
jgi:hypothetical protein